MAWLRHEPAKLHPSLRGTAPPALWDSFSGQNAQVTVSYTAAAALVPSFIIKQDV
jgi:hypothetical protein